MAKLRLKGVAPADRDRLFLVGIGLALSIVMFLAVRREDDEFTLGAFYGRDFVNFWMGGRLALQGQAAMLSDTYAYNQLVLSTYDRVGDAFVFSYPPHILPLLVPFGALPYGLSLFLWTALNLAGLVLAVRQFSPDRRLWLAACLSPATAVMVLYGHFGGLFAWLATFCLRRAADRPIATGLCVAVMSIKPQFAAVLGLVLLAAGRKSWIPTAVAAFAALVGLSILLFGLEPWRGFVEVTLPYQSSFVGDFVYATWRTAITVYFGLRRIGMDSLAALITQYAFSTVILVAAALRLRRSQGRARDLAPVLLVLVAALPYANHYDLVIATPALSVALLADDAEAPGPYMPEIAALVLWVLPLLAMLVALKTLPAAVVLLAFFTLYLLFRRAGGATGARTA